MPTPEWIAAAGFSEREKVQYMASQAMLLGDKHPHPLDGRNLLDYLDLEPDWTFNLEKKGESWRTRMGILKAIDPDVIEIIFQSESYPFSYGAILEFMCVRYYGKRWDKESLEWVDDELGALVSGRLTERGHK